jgi:hypothetical protein
VARPNVTEPSSTGPIDVRVLTATETDLMKLTLALLTKQSLNQLVLIELTIGPKSEGVDETKKKT